MIENTFGTVLKESVHNNEMNVDYFCPLPDKRVFKTHQKLLNWLGQYNDTKLVIWNPEEHVPFCDNYWAGAVAEQLRHDAQTILEQNNIHLEFMLGRLSNEIAYLNDMPNVSVITWPTYWIHHTWYKTHRDTIKKVRNINKLYISLNNRAHYHRCVMIDELANRDLIRYGHISWHKKEMITPYKFKAFKNQKMILDDYQMDLTEGACQEMLPEHYFRTVFNLIVESNYTSPFLTEKTYSAILAKKPFIILGEQGIHARLENLGFKLYNELFDYSFDRDMNLKGRINSICDQIHNHAHNDYKALYRSAKATAKYNYNKLQEIVNDRSSIPEVFWQYDKDKIKYGSVFPEIYNKFGESQ